MGVNGEVQTGEDGGMREEGLHGGPVLSLTEGKVLYQPQCEDTPICGVLNELDLSFRRLREHIFHDKCRLPHRVGVIRLTVAYTLPYTPPG